jgi:hypothetical protein
VFFALNAGLCAWVVRLVATRGRASASSGGAGGG